MVKQIIVLSIIVIVLFIGTVILKNINKEEQFKWNYNNITSAKNVLKNGNEIRNRTLYWQLKEIISDFLITSEDEEITDAHANQEKTDYMEYYEVLSEKYKKHLSKNEFKQKADMFFNKFLLEDHLGYKYVGNFIIQKIYKYNDNMYLCVLIEEYNQEIGYIGIELDEDKSNFRIFYME